MHARSCGAGQRKPESGMAGDAMVLAPEALAEARYVIRFHIRRIVDDDEAVCLPAYVDAAAGRSIGEGIVDQVAQDDVQQSMIDHQRDAVLCICLPHLQAALAYESGV